MKAASESWLSSLSNFLFFLLILFLPTQFGKHFWFGFSSVLGQRIDYLSPTLYVTDVIIILLFLSTLFKRKIAISPLFLLFVLFLSLNVFFSKSPLPGWYEIVKFLELSFVVWYITKTPNLNFQIPNIFLAFSITIIFESILAFAQFFHEGSVGGVFYFLGERTFTALTPGIANASINGQLILRPYGTFSHPNVLAGYLLIGMLLVIYYLSNLRHVSYLVTTVILVGSLGIFISLSRTAITAWLLCLTILFVLYFKNKTKQILFGILAFLTALLLSFLFFPDIVYRFFFSLSDESVVERIALSKAALQMVFSHPVFGVGLGNFISSLPSLDISILQPVHNMYLLVAAELGIPGFLIFASFLFFLLKKIRSLPLLLALSSLLFIGLFDHYFFTLQQGQLLFAVVIGLSLMLTKFSGK